MNTAKTIRMTVRLPEDVHATLTECAGKNRYSLNKMVVVACARLRPHVMAGSARMVKRVAKGGE